MRPKPQINLFCGSRQVRPALTSCENVSEKGKTIKTHSQTLFMSTGDV